MMKLKKYYKNRAEQLIAMANGIDDSEVMVNNWQNKCISSSKTFEKDYTDETFLLKQLYDLAENVAYQLRNQGSVACVIGITIKDSFFKTVNHQMKLKNATNESLEIKEVAKKLFLQKWHRCDVRLLGVRVDQLITSDNYQMSLFEDVEIREKNIRLNQALDNLYQKYGEKVIKK